MMVLVLLPLYVYMCVGQTLTVAPGFIEILVRKGYLADDDVEYKNDTTYEVRNQNAVARIQEAFKVYTGKQVEGNDWDHESRLMLSNIVCMDVDTTPSPFIPLPTSHPIRRPLSSFVHMYIPSMQSRRSTPVPSISLSPRHIRRPPRMSTDVTSYYIETRNLPPLKIPCLQANVHRAFEHVANMSGLILQYTKQKSPTSVNIYFRTDKSHNIGYVQTNVGQRSITIEGVLRDDLCSLDMQRPQRVPLDVQSLLLHGLGHLFGQPHVPSFDSVMLPSKYGPRTLSTADRLFATDYKRASCT